MQARVVESADGAFDDDEITRHHNALDQLAAGWLLDDVGPLDTDGNHGRLHSAEVAGEAACRGYDSRAGPGASG
jgi:pSer/pThr/pTyr-binding forkhead associated (FHA) protein